MTNENSEQTRRLHLSFPKFVTEVSRALQASYGVVLGPGAGEIDPDLIQMLKHYKDRVWAGPEMAADHIGKKAGLSRIEPPKP